VLGAAFGALYLWTGNIWIAAAGHALLDTVGLVIRPSIGRLTGRIFADRTPEPGA
jgi:membrane protease YdiL (CAAX protease family)